MQLVLAPHSKHEEYLYVSAGIKFSSQTQKSKGKGV